MWNYFGDYSQNFEEQDMVRNKGQVLYYHGIACYFAYYGAWVLMSMVQSASASNHLYKQHGNSAIDDS